MTQSHTQTKNEEPLSPEALEIMAKARRRAGISIGIMLIGFMAVVLVVVYRLVTLGSGAEERYGLETIVLPAGAQVISAQAQDGLVTVTYDIEGTIAIRIHDGRSGNLLNEIAVVRE